MNVKNILQRKYVVVVFFCRFKFNFNLSKYPQQQMQLIRKRLKVEFWVDDQLRSLYDIKVNFTFKSIK
jgi:hypothetical protein